MNCPSCGFPLKQKDSPRYCPKCDLDLVKEKAKRSMVVDVAHGGESVAEACRKLELAVNECLWDGHPKLKVIHGYGSQGRRGLIRERVLREMEGYAKRLGCELREDGQNEGAHWLVFQRGK